MNESAQALMELLEQPDEDGLIRAHRITCEGDERRMELLWPELAMAYLTYRMEEAGGERLARGEK